LNPQAGSWDIRILSELPASPAGNPIRSLELEVEAPLGRVPPGVIPEDLFKVDSLFAASYGPEFGLCSELEIIGVGAFKSRLKRIAIERNTRSHSAIPAIRIRQAIGIPNM
jgi:hypothetical protein